MEHGARFLKCDLHMHTPADPAGWSGVGMGDALSDKQKAAEEYVRHCYEQKLELVAITDHNFASKDFLFFLRQAVVQMSTDYGYELTIMAGFEIQADVGKGVHVLAVFDPTVQDEEVDHILTQCGVPLPRFDGKCPRPSPQRLVDILHTVQALGEGGARGIVIFPHCQSNKGVFDNDQLADWLQQEEYKNPDLLCVEVSKPVEQMPSTWQRLFKCDDQCQEQWRRSRPLACIMSSDAKDYGDNSVPHNIGWRYTWIKLSRCTAEGLRQAFLAHKSRIRLSDPEFPRVHISEMHVSNCKFFAQRPFDVPLNRQFNAIIGGRGTGKSTILEYMRWALHDQPPDVPEGDTEVPPYAKNRAKIISETLQQQPEDTHVTVTFCVNETPHIVTRYVRSDRTTLKIGSQPERETNADEVRRLIPLQAYSQKQLSTLAVRIEELRRLIESPLQERLRGLQEQIEDLKREIQRFFTKRGTIKAFEARIRAAEAERTSKKEQIEALRTRA